ncbi:HAD-IA family hydrolase [Stappia sp. GBMRC 2046]|uniref:HAD-IA family hydrolase n=1 Tax=Stappia sediminis TaxID=2692190 RepID=A0A7X3LS52_9HYPH|nr:HAD-IA family hydrolase [Stappia sediminis]
MYLVIFDCDGTLIDSQAAILHGLEAAFRSADLKMPDRRAALSIVGLSLEVALLRLAGEENRQHIQSMAEAYRTSQIALRETGATDPLYPGAMAALDLLSARDDVLLGVATGKALRGVVHMEESHGLTGRFITRQTADRAPSKPHPAMIHQAMEETGADPHRTVMIGDTSFDMEMAKNAGVAALGVSWGYHDAELLTDAGARGVIDHFDQLDAALSGIFDWKKEVA